jgi:hypothetical protein
VGKVGEVVQPAITWIASWCAGMHAFDQFVATSQIFPPVCKRESEPLFEVGLFVRAFGCNAPEQM